MRHAMLLIGLLALCPLTVVAASTVRGSVYDAETYAPRGGVKVSVSGREAITGDDGTFSLDVDSPGPLELHATAAGFDSARVKATAPKAGETSVLIPIARTQVPGRVAGVALYRPDGGKPRPIPDAFILVDGREAVRTDGQGRFVLEKVGPGPVTIQIRALRYAPSEEAVLVPSGGEATLEIALREADDTTVKLGGRVRSQRGKPLKATLRVIEADVSASTDDNGNFQLKILSGTYRLVFEAEGYVSQTKTVEVAPGDQALFYVDLTALE